MALIFIDNLGVSQFDIGAPELYRHYKSSKFLNPQKEETLLRTNFEFNQFWNVARSLPKDLFQIHFFSVGNQILSSLGAVQLVPNRYLIHHSASENNPSGMLRCLKSVTCASGQIPSLTWLMMYFQPGNKWTNRIKKCILNHATEMRTASHTWRYMVATPKEYRVDSSFVRQVAQDHFELVRSLVSEATSESFSEALGYFSRDLNCSSLENEYKLNQVLHSRKMYGYWDGNQLCGVLTQCFMNPILNFSLLCNRSEIYLSRHISDEKRKTVINNLVRVIRNGLAQQGSNLGCVLLEPSDSNFGVLAGLEDSGKEYSLFAWSRQNSYGWPCMIKELDNLYEHIEHRYAS